MPFRGSISAKGKILAPTPFLSLPRQREEELAVHQEQQRSWIVQERIGIAANTTSSALMERAHPTVDRVSTPAAKGLPALAEKISPSSNPQAKLSKVTSWSDPNLEACVVESVGLSAARLFHEIVALFFESPPWGPVERTSSGGANLEARSVEPCLPDLFSINRLLDPDSYVSGLLSPHIATRT